MSERDVNTRRCVVPRWPIASGAFYTIKGENRSGAVVVTVDGNPHGRPAPGPTDHFLTPADLTSNTAPVIVVDIHGVRAPQMLGFPAKVHRTELRIG